MSGTSNTAAPLEPNLKKAPQLSVIEGNKGKDILETRENGKTVRAQIYEFALTPVTALACIAIFQAWKGKDITKTMLVGVAISGFFLLLYKFAPKALIPLWRGWLKIGALLGMVMSNVVLGLMWGLLFYPVSLLLKVIGKAPISMKFKEDKASYWEVRDPAGEDMKLMERQF